ncbi:MAG: RagB/SusD family nutrient uptake outer membrane protein [Candidatus Cryptobacteroides sp.]
MKRKIFALTTFAGILFAASSCIGLDTAPYDRDTDLTYWSKNEGAAEAVLNSCYMSMYSAFEVIEAEGASDNAYVKGLGTTQPIANGSLSTDNSYVKGIWDHYYASIRLCNELLNNIDKVPGLAADLKARYIAECKTLKALFYYELYTKFGAVPYTDAVLTVAESESISRTARETVKQKVVDMLTSAIGDLPESYAVGERGRITSGAAKMLLAKVYLFDGEWNEVKSLTQEIMDSKVYSLMGSYEDVFKVENEFNSEVILDVQYSPVLREWSMRDAGFVPPSLGGYCNIAPTQELVDSYIMLNGKKITDAASGYDSANPYADRDPRLAATVIYTGNSYKMADGSDYVVDCENPGSRDAYGTTSDVTPTGYYFKKWWDPKYRLTLYSSLNTIIFRYADVLLMNAEAHAESGSLNGTVWNNTIGLLRSRAGFTASAALEYDSAADNVEIIRNERRSELAFEGHRYKDIIRWKTAEKVLKGNVHGLYTGAAVGTDNGYVIVEKRNFDPAKHYLWPIPQKDRDLNKNLDQNPNW